MTHTFLSNQVILTDEEELFFKNKTDDYFQRISAYLTTFRRGLNAFDEVKTIDSDYYIDYKTSQIQEGFSFPNYEDSLEDTPIKVGCRLLAEVVSRFVTDRKSHIVDIGAGTGYLAIEVNKLGIENIDCVEPSDRMLDLQPEGLYGQKYKECISSDKPCTIETGKYDCAILRAVVNSGHIEIEDIPELLRIVKAGGYVIFTVSDYWYKFKSFGLRLDSLLQKFLENGVLESLYKERIVYSFKIEDANVFVIKKSKFGNNNNI